MAWLLKFIAFAIKPAKRRRSRSTSVTSTSATSICFYSNRTDFIRTAIRNRLAAHAEEVKKSIVRHTLELGLRHFTRADLEAARAAGEKLHIKVLGLTSIAPDVSPELALATIESITVLGALHATKEIKSALADRIG
jgi:ribbon-helix-helix protein